MEERGGGGERESWGRAPPHRLATQTTEQEQRENMKEMKWTMA